MMGHNICFKAAIWKIIPKLSLLPLLIWSTENDSLMGENLFLIILLLREQSGPSCSKLTTSLVNVSLKFQMLISNIHQYFLLKKCEKLLQCKSFSHFFNKNISVFGYKVVKHLTS